MTAAMPAASAATVGLFEAKTRLSEYVARAERGEEVIITRHNKPVARIVPMTAEAPARPVPRFVQRTFQMGLPQQPDAGLAGELDVQAFLALDARLNAEWQAQQKQPLRCSGRSRHAAQQPAASADAASKAAAD
ncbi:type II toxin-antitoxin system Phd/YefM family antitoxin [Ottowia cancrivicina]|uniref:Antitoxin n=1 Tax=Ottowia cancrivicina TaxID=3040346 RepID=A0AAW6RHY7_9BURK|nr:type II toxin-antitoxin system prevent-host-death family antitoxin [Ottowia sp. 10c7w1]MDG9699855.1 type II toxin-antitoxin system prevent-host-death family antitoxin [Ottowia sp. 10c7w1]